MTEVSADPTATTRPRPSRRAVAIVVALDLVIATAVGVGVYFATRRFGPPTPTSERGGVGLGLRAGGVPPGDAVGVPPLGASPRGWRREHVRRPRGGEEIGRLGPRSTEYADEDVTMGKRYEYEVVAIGDEGRGRPSPPVSIRTPIPRSRMPG